MDLPDPSWQLALVLLCVLAAEFVNGWNSAPNAIATVVCTRVVFPSRALAMASALNLLGVVVTGTAVAATIGKGIVDAASPHELLGRFLQSPGQGLSPQTLHFYSKRLRRVSGVVEFNV